MFRDILEEFAETVGPIAVKVLALAACLLVFAPLVIALVAPMLQ